MKYALKVFTTWITYTFLLGGNPYVFAENVGDAVNTGITKNDFAYGIEITTKNNQAIQASVLPAHFYEHLRNSTLSDYRVFDSRGEIMPSLIKNPNINTSKTETKPLNFYPIHAPLDKELDSLSLSLDREKNKLSVLIDDTNKTEEKSRLIAYIIENSERTAIDKLNFEWLKPETGFIKNIHLEHSSDLITWSNLKRDGSLSRLQHKNQMIGNNSIKINTKTKQYIRLSWDTSNTDFIISNVSANYKQKSQKSLVKKYSVQAILESAQDSAQPSTLNLNQSAFTFTLPGAYPINNIELNSALDNYSFQTQVFSRLSFTTTIEKPNRWRDQGKMDQYHLVMDDQVLQSEPKNLWNIKRNEWLLSFIEPRNVKSPPEVTVTWQPEYLVFLAQGKSPYTLAYGNPTIQKRKSSISQMIGKLTQDEWQNITKRLNPLTIPKELGGPGMLIEPAATKPWRIIMLWAALVLGVLAMGWMVFRLIKDTKIGVSD